MPHFLIATQRDGSPTGTILGIEEAPSPEEALIKVANRFISDELLDSFLEESDGTVSYESRFKMLKWVLSVSAESDVGDVIIYPLHGDEYGGVKIHDPQDWW